MLQENGDVVSWEVYRGRTLGPAPFFVVGIVNATPDSFYDGGLLARTEDAVAHGLRLVEQGADMIDVGGESTRPFSAPISAEEEAARVLPVVQGLLAIQPEMVLSVDTTKAVVAKACLEAGALVVNDVSALDSDPELLDVLLEFQPGYVLMHSQGAPRTMQVEPRYDSVVDEIRRFFEIRMTRLVRAGLPESRIVLDPGIGFGKTLEHNLEILRNISEFQKLGRPVYMGLSNKSLWRELLGREGRERNAATLAATVALYAQGVRIHRVHEVRESRDALIVAQVLTAGQGETRC